jgi:tetratricopeptide (TPR) repeat protein
LRSGWTTNDADAYYARGVAYHKQGEFDKAISDYSDAIRLDRNNADAYYARGTAYHSKGSLTRP